MRKTVTFGLYLGGSVAFLAAMFAIYLTIIEPEVTRGSGPAELVSPHGRIRIAEVQSFTMSRGSDEQSPNDPTATLTSVYVPSYLPDGFSHGDTRLMTKTSVGHLFEGGDTTLMVVQSPSASLTAKVGSVKSIDVNGRSGFLIHGGWSTFDESAAWDPGKGLTLLLELDDAMVSLHDEESRLTKRQLVSIGESLEPNPGILSRLLEESAHPQRIADELPSSFGALYMPSYLPEGYVARGGEARPEWGYTELRYRNSLWCALTINQHAQGSPMGPDIARRATFGPHETRVENGNQFHIGYRVAPKPVSGVTFYLSDPHPGLFNEHWFAHEGIWFNFRIDTPSVCNSLDIQEVARIAKSLQPAI